MRLSMLSVIGLVFLNGATEFLVATGLASALGVPSNIGGSDKLNAALNAAREIQPGAGLGDTLFLAFQAMANTFLAIIEGIFAGPTMLANLGVPVAGVALLFAPVYLIVARDVMFVLIGRSP